MERRWSYLAAHRYGTLREGGDSVGIAERATARVVRDPRVAGYLAAVKTGDGTCMSSTASVDSCTGTGATSRFPLLIDALSNAGPRWTGPEVDGTERNDCCTSTGAR
jgi:hypothetical protein